MSEPLRVAVVAEGPTDRIVIEAALTAILGERSHIVTQLQPEESMAFGDLGSGWAGVYKWCRSSARTGGGRISGNTLLESFDLVVLHLDADVADVSYGSSNITPEPTDLPLPCAQPCPPPTATTNALGAVLLSWCGETSVPPRTVVCMPSKSTECWVVSALFPDDREIHRAAPFECHAIPANRLSQQPLKRRIRKCVPHYRTKQSELIAAWPVLAGPGGLGQAAAFDADVRQAIA